MSDITQHTATLAWKPPEYDGGCKITHYFIERKETTHNQWVIAASYCKVLLPYFPRLIWITGIRRSSDSVDAVF